MGTTVNEKNRRTERRHSRHGQHMTWREEGAKYRFRLGWLCDESDHGMSFFVDIRRRPHAGEKIELRTRPVDDLRHYRVVHASRTSGRLSLVGCERLPTQGTPNASPAPGPHHLRTATELRSQPPSVALPRLMANTYVPTWRGGLPEHRATWTEPSAGQLRERRQSPRWPCQTTLVWRCSPERRIRGGCIVERSLEGMVIRVSAADAVGVGAVIRPIDQAAAGQHRFHRGVVRRVTREEDGSQRLAVELTT